jgi:hypothetical protein
MRLVFLLLLAGCNDDPPITNDLSVTVCTFSSGRVCGYDSLGGCVADDDCNWCDCSTPGGTAACTLAACVTDAGPAMFLRCEKKEDCPSGHVCAFDPGCNSEPGRCTTARECTSGSPASFCDCNGQSFQSAGLCADRPHAVRGPCQR